MSSLHLLYNTTHTINVIIKAISKPKHKGIQYIQLLSYLYTELVAFVFIYGIVSKLVIVFGLDIVFGLAIVSKLVILYNLTVLSNLIFLSRLFYLI